MSGMTTANMSQLTRSELWSSELKEILRDEMQAQKVRPYAWTASRMATRSPFRLSANCKSITTKKILMFCTVLWTLVSSNSPSRNICRVLRTSPTKLSKMRSTLLNLKLPSFPNRNVQLWHTSSVLPLLRLKLVLLRTLKN
jgi:type II secretory pathway component PulF